MCNKDLVHWTWTVGGRGGTDRCHSNLMAKFIWKETMASVVQQRHRNWLSWLGLRRNLKKIVKKNVKWKWHRDRGAACAHSPPPHAVPWCFLTFFLSHAFFFPGAAKQHQPHPPTDAELRERASRLCLTNKRRVRATAAQPGRRSSRLLRLPAARFLRRFIQDRLRPIRM